MGAGKRPDERELSQLNFSSSRRKESVAKGVKMDSKGNDIV